MNISELHSAKGLKFKLQALTEITQRLENEIVDIRSSNDEKVFLIRTRTNAEYEFSTDKKTAAYLRELLPLDKMGEQRNLFVVESEYPEKRFVEIQSYAFASMTEYQTPIIIQVPESILEKDNNKYETLRKTFVCDDTGKSALFVLRYKSKKRTDIRAISGNRFLNIKQTPRGLIVTKLDSKRDRTQLPVDVYIAPKIEFVKETGNTAIDGTLAKDLDSISGAATYFSRWEAYNKLVEKEINIRIEEFGKIPYSDCKKYITDGGIKFVFHAKEKVDISCTGETIAVLNAGEDKRGNKQNVRVGEIISISDNRIETMLRQSDGVVSIPQTGNLVLFVFGDKVIVNRRKKARDRMVGLRSPIKAIVPLIETGASEYSSVSNWTNHKGITTDLTKNFKQAKTLNDQQKKALELAINTPDIALIQGPPGTGKTLVIKAICERFREIYENENNGERPKILISSFQNEAVDNAIASPLPGELPAFRIGKKREEHFKASVTEWVEGVKNELQKTIGGYEESEFSRIRNSLSDAYFSYKNTGEKLADGIKIIEEYLSVIEIKYPSSLREKARKIIEQFRTQGRPEEPEINPIVEYLKAQRLTIESFSDDGDRNVNRLLAYIRRHSEISINESYISAINAAADNGIGDENIRREYEKSVKALLEEFNPKGDEENPLGNSQIDICLQELAVAFDNGKLSSTNDLEARKAMVLGEFLDRFEDEAESLVGKYSLTTAATCQQSMPLSSSGDESYDLVIVDEAARATPLDLFIPMSMGRKIILVGDQKQLPHMLEPEVLKLILEDPEYKDLPDLNKSLFERLYDMFQTQDHPKSIFLDMQYRMHPDICEFVSEVFYDKKLKAGITRQDREIPSGIFGGRSLAYIDITKKQGTETGGISKSRPAEARLIARDVKKISELCPDKKIGIITFYSAQKDLIETEVRKVLDNIQFTKVEIGSVDAFQGKEFDFVCLSCVRSNSFAEEKQSVGFLVKPNRVCVALSRAKCQLAVYGDSETINKVECFKILYKKCVEKNEGYYHAY